MNCTRTNLIKKMSDSIIRSSGTMVFEPLTSRVFIPIKGPWTSKLATMRTAQSKADKIEKIYNPNNEFKNIVSIDTTPVDGELS